MSDEAQELLRWLPGLLSRRNEDGSFRYGEREVLDFLAVLIIEVGFDPAGLPPEFVALLGDFARRVGVPDGADPETAKHHILEYLEAHPLNPEMSFELRRGLQEGLSVPNDEDVGDAFRRFMASEQRDFSGLLRKAGARQPAGSRRGGALAVMLAARSFDK